MWHLHSHLGVLCTCSAFQPSCNLLGPQLAPSPGQHGPWGSQGKASRGQSTSFSLHLISSLVGLKVVYDKSHTQ